MSRQYIVRHQRLTQIETSNITPMQMVPWLTSYLKRYQIQKFLEFKGFDCGFAIYRNNTNFSGFMSQNYTKRQTI